MTPDYDTFVDRYGDRVQCSDGRYDTKLICARGTPSEIEDMIGLLGAGRKFGGWYDLRTDHEGDTVQIIAQELMKRFEAKGEYGMFYNYHVGRRHWQMIFG